MTAILQDNGDLLVPVGACAAAERVQPDDPRYAELLAGSMASVVLCGTPEEDVDLSTRFAQRYRARQSRIA